MVRFVGLNGIGVDEAELKVQIQVCHLLKVERESYYAFGGNWLCPCWRNFDG